ncbi:NUDIX domain-containing protein [Micromonospora sp. DR5-3]|uniref:NUDIX domain-containing protein n=1 Tax=unclassified Micromonospora TaxID=2617518 RepID=UPI0011D78849|nr:MULTISPECIES: NUDIX domain-containing protein [unclassified Micromonospora]MCW3819487.1 NUDIX domain-containing protein [Micromonospora sp. DR5-3]TYC21309.1 NUDIX domain-containing protein [Micromonospora sp. MP36]
MHPIACVLLVDRAGRLLLQLRDAHAPHHPNVWGLPGGHWEPGETIEEAALRELWEETGLRPAGPLRLAQHAIVSVRERGHSPRVSPAAAAGPVAAHHRWVEAATGGGDGVVGQGRSTPARRV